MRYLLDTSLLYIDMNLPESITAQWPVASLFALFSLVQLKFFINYLEKRNGHYNEVIEKLIKRIDEGFAETRHEIERLKDCKSIKHGL